MKLVKVSGQEFYRSNLDEKSGAVLSLWLFSLKRSNSNLPRSQQVSALIAKIGQNLTEVQGWEKLNFWVDQKKGITETRDIRKEQKFFEITKPETEMKFFGWN